MTSFLRTILDAIARFIGLIYWSNQKYLPPITNRILLQPAVQISQQIKSGKLKCEDVVNAYIERCKAVQPHINAIIQDNFDRAIEEAKQVDSRVKRELEGILPENESQSIHSQPFLGVPFTTKDSIAVKDMYWTSGLCARKGITSDVDSDVIALMRSAGAIFLALTNVPEMLMWWDTHNKLYGRTYNPYDKSRICGGSSGGEGALIASAGSLCGASADIGGSIRMPCFFCGIFGHKTTPEIVSTKGLFPEVSAQQQKLLSFGPMSRYATDLKPLLKVMSGSNASKLDLDQTVDLKQLKYYYMEDDDNCNNTAVQSDIRDAIHKVVKHFDGIGAQTKKVYFKQFKYGFEIWMRAMADPNAPKFSQLLANLKGEINPIKEFFLSLIGLSNHCFWAIMLSMRELKSKSRHKSVIREPTVVDRKTQLKLDLDRDLNQLLGKDGIFIFPAHPEEAIKPNGTLFKVHNISYTQVFNALNVAITSVPLGLSKNGLPIGLQIISSPLNDRLTIAVAEELERAFGGWVCPSDINC